MMEQFGRYILLERIAEGGMAEVFRAAVVGSAGFNKIVAIKRILPHLAKDESFVAMLVDEAKIAATLVHPNILQVMDLGDHKGVYFIAMEFVVGRSLDAVIHRAQQKGLSLPPEFCASVIRDALQGLNYAHKKTDSFGSPAGIIHRDISPQNIMVGYDGSVRLADFGIARAAERTTHTVTGSIKGKPGYMSPEQVMGRAIDHRLDIYAMGVVLHEMLCMQRMRKGGTDAQVLVVVASGAFPTFEQQGVTVDPALAQVVYKALALDPANRWADAHTFSSALDEVSRAQGWHCGPTQIAQLMQHLFAPEIERERQAQLHFAQLLKDPILDGDSLAVELDGPGGTVTRTVRHTGVSQIPPGEPLGRNAVTPMNLTSVGGGARQPAGNRMAWLLGSLMALGLTAAAVSRFAPGVMPGGTAPPVGVASLVVETDPPGAQVFLGGALQSGVSPLVVKDLPVGPLEVEARMEGMAPVKDVRILQAAETATVKLTLRAVAAAVMVAVTSEPTGAKVTVAGTELGRTPLSVPINGKNAVTLILESPGHHRVERVVNAADAPKKLHVKLVEKDRADSRVARPLPPPSPDANGRLTIVTRPWGRVSIDREDTLRSTPFVEFALPPGKHVISVHNPEENLSTDVTVDIRPGELTTISRDLN